MKAHKGNHFSRAGRNITLRSLKECSDFPFWLRILYLQGYRFMSLLFYYVDYQLAGAMHTDAQSHLDIGST